MLKEVAEIYCRKNICSSDSIFKPRWRIESQQRQKNVSIFSRYLRASVRVAPRSEFHTGLRSLLTPSRTSPAAPENDIAPTSGCFLNFSETISGQRWGWVGERERGGGGRNEEEVFASRLFQ